VGILLLTGKRYVTDAVLDKFAPAQAKATPEPKKPKAMSRFDQAAQNSSSETKAVPGKHLYLLRRL
jgi:hypothetical protein